MDRTAPPDFLAGLSTVAPRYRALLCDVWGVIHNGLANFADAVDALRRFRAAGGIVVLITNAPRPDWSVRDQLDGLAIDRAAYDRIVTSGDVSAQLLIDRGVSSVYHLGPDRDLTLYRDLPVRLAPPHEADIVCCTGLVDDTVETAEDYDGLLRQLLLLDREMICANPDILVERGHQLVPCAGALAERYAAMGGITTIVGKPLPRIYEVALATIDELAGGPVDRASILAVGDGARTDIAGANSAGIPSLFITSGIHAAEYGSDLERVRTFLDRSQAVVSALMPRLAW